MPASPNARESKAIGSLSNASPLLFALLDNFPQPSLIHDTQAICYANLAVARLWGSEEATQLSGQPLGAILPHHAQRKSEPAQAAKGSPPVTRLKRRDGQLVEVTLQESRFETGTTELFHVVISPLEAPIPEATEEQLKPTAYLHALGESSPDIMLVIKQDGGIEYLNRTSGRPPVEQFIGMCVFELLKEPDVNRLQACMKRVAEHGKIDQCLVSFDNRAGEFRIVEARICPVVQRGQVTAFAINGHDITDQLPVNPSSAGESSTGGHQQSLEQIRTASIKLDDIAQSSGNNATLVRALRRAHDEIQHVTASVSTGLFSLRVNQDGQWSDFYRSPVTETIIGRSFESSGNHPRQWLTIVHPEDQSSVLETLQRLLRCAPTQDELECRITNSVGTTKWVRTSTNSRRTIDGSIRMDGVITDITEHKAAEEALRESDEQLRRHHDQLAHAGRLSTLGELVASIAHEINQPLHAISNYAGACQNALADASPETLDRVARWAQEIGTQSRRAGEIITRLGNFVRKAPPHRSTLNINDLVIDSLDLLRFEARRHQVRIGIELAPPASYILCDRVQIQQVLVNLIRNAFDALECVPPAKRRVAIAIESFAEQITVHVEDGGIGLTTDEHAQLFKPFFTTKEHGMGMGLAISRSIIESHGGRLWATKNSDAGTTFHFQLARLPGGIDVH